MLESNLNQDTPSKSSRESRRGHILNVAMPLYTHRAILLSGVEAIHASKERGRVVIEPIAHIIGNREYGVTAPPNQHVEAAIQRARTRLGEPYRLFDNNCEHFVSWAFTGQAHSPQLQAWKGVAACLSFAVLLGACARR